MQLVAFLLLGLALGGTPSPVGASAQTGSDAGTVETLAGPDFCPGDATVDPASVSVEGLAVDASATVHAATGGGPEGVVVRVDDLGRAVLLRTGAADDGAGPGAAGNRQVASDGDGGAFVALGNRLVHLKDGARRMIAGGEPSTMADSIGDGGPAGDARFRRLLSLTADWGGNVYVADEVDARTASFRIRYVNRAAEPRTFRAGTADEVTVHPGHIGTVTGTVLAGRSPTLAAVGDLLYVASLPAGAGPTSGTVRIVNLGASLLPAHGALLSPGAIGTVGGDEPPGEGWAQVTGMAADDSGNVYLAEPERHRVARVDSAGAVSTLAGTGVAGFNGNGGPANAAKLDRPHDVEIGPFGRVYVSDQGNGQVRYVDANGTILAAPGNGAALRWTCEAPNQARPGGPSSVVADDRGNVYFAASSMAQVKQISATGKVTTVVGRREGPTYCAPPRDCADIGDGAPAAGARLLQPSSLALSDRGGLYILDSADARIRLVNLGSRPLTAHGMTVKPGAIETVAGSGRVGSAGDGGKAVAAELLNAGSLAVDREGNLFLADASRVRRIDPDGILTTFVAPGPPGQRDRCCLLPTGVTVDRSGNLFVADAAGRLWVFNRTQTTLNAYGVSLAPGSSEAITGARAEGSDALFSAGAVTVAGDGSLYVLGENSVQMVDPAGTVTTVAGTGALGFNGDGLKARLTTFSFPTGLAVDRCGNVVVADRSNERVRRVLLPAECAAAAPSLSTGRGGTGATGLRALSLLVVVVGGTAAAWRTRRHSRPIASQ